MPDLIRAERDAMAYLRSPVAIRERCQQVLELAYADRLRHFAYRPEKLPEVAAYVAEVTRDAYSNLDVPFHSRWRHFDVSGLDRVAQLDEQLGACSPAERARCHFDLVITSVLLDAGAGEHWRYHEARSGQTYSRSEGLAVASLTLSALACFRVGEITLAGRRTRLAERHRSGPGRCLPGHCCQSPRWPGWSRGSAAPSTVVEARRSICTGCVWAICSTISLPRH